MLKDKQNRYNRKKICGEALTILGKHGEPTAANIKDYPAKAMQKLYEWKLNKSSKKAREDLLKEYLKAPVPLKDAEWTTADKIELKELLTGDMYAKDTALGVQLKQTARAITNNVDDLDGKSRRNLLRVLQAREDGESTEERQTGFM